MINKKDMQTKPLIHCITNPISINQCANAVLAGIAMELGASILFTPEESGKTHGSVRELAIASKMMFEAAGVKFRPYKPGGHQVKFEL